MRKKKRSNEAETKTEKQTAKGNRAAIYVRVSSESDNRTASLSTQTDACKASAIEHGYEVRDEDIFIERHSGRYLRERAELSRLRELANQGLYAAVVFYKIDRLTRGGAGHIWTMLPQFKELGIEFWSVMEKETFSPTNPLRDTMITFHADIAKKEIDDIRDRVQRGLQKKVEEGKHPGNGGDLYGYRMNKETWKREIFEDEAKVISWIFESAKDGVSTKKIATTLQSRGIPSLGTSLGRKRASYKWFSAVVARIIRNRAYIGKTTVNREDKEIELDDVTPAIVSAELFEQANLALDNKLGRIQTRNEDNFVMLRGLVFCLRCGSRSYPKADGRGYISFFCSSQDPERHKDNCGSPQLSSNWLNHWVWSSLRQHLSSQESCEQMIQDLQKEQDDLSPLYRDRDRAENRIKEIEVESNRLARSIARTDDEGVISILERELKELSKQRRDVDDFLNSLTVEIHQREKEQIDICGF